MGYGKNNGGKGGKGNWNSWGGKGSSQESNNNYGGKGYGGGGYGGKGYNGGQSSYGNHNSSYGQQSAINNLTWMIEQRELKEWEETNRKMEEEKAAIFAEAEHCKNEALMQAKVQF